MAKIPHDELITRAISDLRSFLTDLSASGNTKDKKRASLISYWISDYVKMLRKEDIFDSKKLIRYKRGQIVKVHLGYRIGSEEGGLHYAVVVEKNNPLSSNVVTVIPLTSLKPKHDPTQLSRGNLYLGNALYRILRSKLDAIDRQFNEDIKNECAEIEKITIRLLELQGHCRDKSYNTSTEKELEINEIRSALEKVKEQLESSKKAQKRVEKIKNELQQMKLGSIALVNQITTISKQRIYDPLYKSDVFHEVRVSNEILDALDTELIKMFTNCYQEK